MSISETEKIDIIAARSGSPIVKMIITDHLTWDDTEDHIRLLQAKINTYIEFVEAGHLRRLSEPQIPKEPEIRITLAVQHQPSDDAQRYLLRVAEFLVSIGLKFEIELREARA